MKRSEKRGISPLSYPDWYSLCQWSGIYHFFQKGWIVRKYPKWVSIIKTKPQVSPVLQYFLLISYTFRNEIFLSENRVIKKSEQQEHS